MNRITLKENFSNYERVKRSFKDFIHTIVWESLDIDEGVDESEVNEHIDKYCSANEKNEISNILKDVTEFVKSLSPRYMLRMYKDANGGFTQIETNNFRLVFEKAAKFYRENESSKITIFDKDENRYIAEWD